ncbi:MAG TPA: hypothetical protein VFH23_08845 [Jiangellaceae bacterium]|nr:hypothetical protein [Jiangellaceae bacterium]
MRAGDTLVPKLDRLARSMSEHR